MNTRQKFYRAVGLDDYELCHPIEDEGFEALIVALGSRSSGQPWNPPPMMLHRTDEDDRPLHRSDSPWLGSHALLFRSRAILALGRLLRDDGELLPIRCDGTELKLFNPHMLDALDEDASSLMRLDSGTVLRITTAAFRPEVVRDVNAFKIPNLRVSPTYLSQAFVDGWHAAGLDGLQFCAV